MNPNLSDPENGYPGNIRKSENAHALNVLIGIGVLGALFTSIWIFGGFSSNEQTKLLTNPRGYNFRLFSGVSIALEGKMVAMIALAFGAGIVAFLKSPKRTEKPSRIDLYIRRQIWLIVLGVLNAIILFWTNDILFHLGIMGILLFSFFRISVKGLAIASIVTLLFFSGKLFWNYADHKTAHSKYLVVIAKEKKIKADSAAIAKTDTAKARAHMKKDTLTKKQTEEKGAWEGIVKSMKYDSTKDKGNIKAMREESFGKIYNHLLGGTQAREAQWFYRQGIWDLASMMFIGMALFGFGFFSGRLKTSQYLLIAVTGITAGILLGWYRFYFQIEVVRDYEKYVTNHFLPFNVFFPFEQWFMTIGYAGAVRGLMNAGAFRKIFNGFSSVGRLGLTNYFLQTIICSTFFTGLGMGYFARLTQQQLYLFVLEVTIVQIVLAVLWVRKFEEGPVEWLWRCLTYGKVLPIKRKESSAVPTVIAS